MTVLDADMLVGLLREEEEAIDAAMSLDDVRTTVINACELYKGAFLTEDPLLERERVEELLRTMAVLNLVADLVPEIGEVLARLEQAGTPIGVMDAMIGVITREHGETLLTRNVGHFELIPDLAVAP